ncbi:hypothetical protein ACQ4WQ_10065 [Janthinobacterium sp. GB1R12]|uniref:hypothetical protein n=1 Tax=Janthinobacterium sp. GB1R12 TaxID=3424190 RepID=UPI003F299881
MGAGFWISRYLLASSILFTILTVVDYSKGNTSMTTLLGALAWSLVASAIFIGSKYWRYRKAVACAACSGDKPKTRSS